VVSNVIVRALPSGLEKIVGSIAYVNGCYVIIPVIVPAVPIIPTQVGRTS